MRSNPHRSTLATVGSLAGLTLALAACADPLSPTVDAGGLRPVAAVGSDVGSPLQETFGSGMETSAGRDTRIEVNSGMDGVEWIPAYVLSKNVRWHDPIAGTSWIGPRETSNVFYSYPQINDEYRTTFDIPAGATAPALNVHLWSDNAATVYVNGVQIGQQPQTDDYSNYGCNDTVPADTCSSFATTPYAYTTTGEAIPWNIGGENSLRIVVLNAEYKQGCENVSVPTPECASASGLDFLAEVRYILRGDEGCTPGYWKQEQHFDSWAAAGYSPDQTVGSVFTGAGAYAGISLDAALDLGGGAGVEGARRILLRAAVAALLNSASPDVDYTMTTAEVVAAVNAALASNDRSTMLDLAGDLDHDNNLGCPLN